MLINSNIFVFYTVTDIGVCNETKQGMIPRSGVYFIIVLTAVIILFRTGPGKRGPIFQSYDPELFAKVKDSIFEGFDNLIGTKNSSNIVPNYVHFLFFGNPRISYVHSVCILAAFRNQKPERIYFHTNIKEFKGPHWIKIRDTLGSVLHFANVTLPTEIFGHKFTRPYHVYHASDVTRIRILMEYGGIFLDNDSYIVKSLDPFRRYEMTIGVTNGEYLGTQVLIAHKDARFLKLWLECYRDYQAHSFYFNAGEKPMVEIIRRKPELVHSIRYSLGVEGLTRNLYVWDTWSNWRRYYSIHLMIRHRRYMDTLWNYLQWRTLDESNICDYPHPFGEMAREVYSDFCPRSQTDLPSETVLSSLD
ncbi:hypothetical protein L9F63_009699 [Diploptera punctata]|uniref:Alpha-1,4-N-acetylglucosaminyltransferase n=1 Tax=Diploptera punctata TaxID=6984 RepID=A0AAD8AJ45_DIPPU|nr:hypothetical protein L9F63_009699 [Diploptera punctata]